MPLNVLEIEQEGVGKLRSTEVIPLSLHKYVLNGARAFYLVGDGVTALFQLFHGEHFQVWYSRYWTTKPVVLMAKGNISTLELRICVANEFKSTWERAIVPELPEYNYQFTFVPFTVTRVTFEGGKEYKTFDVHFGLPYFEKLSMGYRMFQQFLEHVLKDLPADLYSRPRPCSGAMMDAMHGILHNNYSSEGRTVLVANNVANIFLSVLEDVDPDRSLVFHLSNDQYEQLHVAKRIIEDEFPDYVGNKALCKRVRLNITYLCIGFKQLFGENPYEYYNLLRMDRAKELLRRGVSVHAIAMELKYETDGAFSKAFKLRFNMPPKEYQVRSCLRY